MSSRNNPFRHRFRVRYAEVDPQSVVFNSRYLEYADVVITEYWRELGVHFVGEEAVEFHVAKAIVEFRKPIRADEWVEGRIWTERLGNSSLVTRIELHGTNAATDNSAPADDLRAEIEQVHVHVDLESGRSVPLTDRLRRVFTGEKDTADA